VLQLGTWQESMAPATPRVNMFQRALLTLIWVLATVAPAAARADSPRWIGFSDPLFTHHTDAETASGTSIAQDGSHGDSV
jgi:hypothetical protein